jgi:exodeoxyribonuclease III
LNVGTHSYGRSPLPFVWPRSTPNGPDSYTFWEYFRNAYGRDAGLRIDHLLLNAAAVPRLRKADVCRTVRGWEKASDHAPTRIELAG